MISQQLMFVSFQPLHGKFQGLLMMEDAITREKEPERVLRQAEQRYENAIQKMISIIDEIERVRASKKPLPARKIWDLGNDIFILRDNLEKLGLELDGLYAHLCRDLNVKRKWLEKAIILRRYLPKKTYIPKSLNWGRCEKGTRRVAERLRQRLPLP